MAWTEPGTQIGLYSEGPETQDPPPRQGHHFPEEEMEVQGVGMGSAPMGRATLDPLKLSSGGLYSLRNASKAAYSGERIH